LIEHLSSDQNHEVMMFDTEGVYDIGLSVTVGDCSTTIWKQIFIYEDESSLTNPQNHQTLEGFIVDFSIDPMLNAGQWNATVATNGNTDISLFLINEVGVIIDTRSMNITNTHVEDYNMAEIPSGVYAIVLMTENDWRYITFTKL